MSIKVTKKDVTERAKDSPWRSGRSRWNLQQFRRGRDKQWHFPGQQPDEVVRMVVRKHKLFLIKPALPLLGTIAALALVIWAHIKRPELQGLWIVLEIGISLLIIGTFLWFIWRDFIVWWVETYTITNKRIINSRGILQPVRQQTEISKVTQVGIEQKGPLSLFLSYGTLHVYLTGSDFFIKDVPNPKEVKDAIQGLTEELKAKKAPEEKPPVPQDQDLKDVLAKLAKGQDVPKLQDADEHYPERHPDKPRGPRRTFGGPLHIPCEIRYASGEFTVEYIQRSRYVLYRNLALPVLFFVITPLAAIRPALVLPAIWFIAALVMLALLVTMGLIITNYVDDVFILTNNRIIEIERRLIFLFEVRIEVKYENIRDLRVTVSNPIQRLLDVGNVYIETPGSSPNIVFSYVDHPFLIMDQLSAIKGYKDKVKGINDKNASKKEFNVWFANILTTLEGKWLTKGAPNLQRMDLWSAVECANEFGLEVVTIGEDSSFPELPPGLVVRQNPPPGTMINKGGEIQVYLSKRG